VRRGRRLELRERQRSVEQQPPVGACLNARAFLVEFVLDLADELFEDVFERDEARRAAVFVHDDSQMKPVPLEKRQGVLDLRPSGMYRGVRASLVRSVAPEAGGALKQVLHVDDTDD
jgi:hypothetical protein